MLSASRNHGVCSVAAHQVGSLAHFQRSVGPLQARDHTIACVLEVHQLRATLDVDAELGEAIDQQPLVLVLRIDEREGIRTDTHPHVAEHRPCHLHACYPQIRGADPPSTLDDLVGETDLSIELERTRLHRDRTRRRPRLRRLVGDLDAHA
jgi:hypothetical protein